MSTYKIYFSLLNNFIDEFFSSKLLPYISERKQHRANHMKSTIDKKLTIFPELLVRALACRLYGVKNNEILFTQNRHGKPRIVGLPHFHFNISHSHNAMVVAIAEKSVGIDIERLRDADLNIANRFFSTQERAFIVNQTNKQSDFQRRFYEIWTKKEAYLKQIGKGLSIPLNTFDVIEGSIQERTFCFEIEGYIISICGTGSIYREDIEIVQLSEHDLLHLIASEI